VLRVQMTGAQIRKAQGDHDLVVSGPEPELGKTYAVAVGDYAFSEKELFDSLQAEPTPLRLDLILIDKIKNSGTAK